MSTVSVPENDAQTAEYSHDSLVNLPDKVSLQLLHQPRMYLQQSKGLQYITHVTLHTTFYAKIYNCNYTETTERRPLDGRDDGSRISPLLCLQL